MFYIYFKQNNIYKILIPSVF